MLASAPPVKWGNSYFDLFLHLYICINQFVRFLPRDITNHPVPQPTSKIDRSARSPIARRSRSRSVARQNALTGESHQALYRSESTWCRSDPGMFLQPHYAITSSYTHLTERP